MDPMSHSATQSQEVLCDMEGISRHSRCGLCCACGGRGPQWISVPKQQGFWYFYGYLI